MRLIRIDLDGEEMPEHITFTLTLKEVALLYRLTGHSAPIDVRTASGSSVWAEANDEIASCVNNFLNRFWDDGVDAIAPKFSPASIVAAFQERQG